MPGKSSPEILSLAFRATNRQDRQNLTVVKLVLVDRKATKIGNQSDQPLGSPRRRKTRELMILQEEAESSKYHISKKKKKKHKEFIFPCSATIENKILVVTFTRVKLANYTRVKDTLLQNPQAFQNCRINRSPR